MQLPRLLSAGPQPARIAGALMQFAAAHRVALGVLLLLLCGWKFTFGLSHVLDLDTSWHEARYLAWVTHHAPAPVPADYSPLYVAFYKFEGLFAADPVRLYYLNDAVIATLLPAAFFVFLSAQSVPFAIALPSAAYVLISAADLAVAPKPVHFGLTIMFLALALGTRLADGPRKWALLLLTGAVLSLVRPEFLPSLLLLSCYVGYRVVCSKKPAAHAAVVFGLAGPPIALFYAWLGLPLFNGKSIQAFEEHFALNYAKWHRLPGEAHTADHAAIFHTVFGDPQSIPAALLANPGAFLHHVLTNIAHLPTTLAELFLAHYNLLLPRFTMFTMAEAAMLAFALAIGLLAHRRAAPVGGPGAIRERHGAFGMARNAFDALLRACPDAIPLLCFLVPFPVMMTVLYPRYHYTLGLGMILLAIVLVCLGRQSRPAPFGRRELLLLVVVFALMPSLGSAGASFLFRPGAITVEPRPNWEIVRFLRQVRTTAPVRICETGWAEPYLGSNFTGVLQAAKAEPFSRFITDENISIVVADDRLRSDPRFDRDPEWHAFEHDPAALGFTAHTLPSGVVIYLRNDLPVEAPAAAR